MNRPFWLLSVVIALSIFGAQRSSAQSIAVAVPGNSPISNNSASRLMRAALAAPSDPLESSVSNSLAPGVLAIEQAMAGATWGQLLPATGEPRFEQIMSNIEQLGFPVILDDSSDLKPETRLEFRNSPAISGMPLDRALVEFLKTHNSAIRVTPDALIIHSVDEAYEELDRVVYNVSALFPNQSPDDAIDELNGLIRVIQNVIDPTSWEVEGPSAMPIATGGQRLLVIVNRYEVHRQIREFFREMAMQTTIGGVVSPSRAAKSEFGPRSQNYDCGGQF